MPDALTADDLTGDRTLTGTVEVDGAEKEFEHRDAPLSEYDDVDERVAEEADGNPDETKLARAYVDEFLVEPDVDADNVAGSLALTLYFEMAKNVYEPAGIADALEAMQMDGEGNR
jgi:hypothetical protein